MNTKNIIFITVAFIVIITIVGVILVKLNILKMTYDITIPSILSFLSLIIATLGFVITSNNYNNTQKQYNEQQVQKRKANERSQALNIAGWYEGYTDGKQIGDNLYQHQAKVTIENATNIPVYQMFVFLISNKIDTKFNSLHVPGNIPDPTIKYIELVKPDKTEVVVNANGPASGGENDSVAILFKDTSSRYWYRSNFGSLEQISEQEKTKIFLRNQITGPYNNYAH